MGITLLALSLMFHSQVLSIDSYYVSEIFANAPGSKSDLKSQWLELRNISERSIIISAIKLELFEAESLKPTWTTQRALESPLVFDDYLLVANASNLGLDACLNHELSIILMPEFRLRAKKAKICVTINHQESVCANLGSQAAFLDGVSLFRTYENAHIGFMWQSEPCRLVDHVFATPGLSDRACADAPDFAADILVDCEKPQASAYQLELKSFHDRQGFRPYFHDQSYDPSLGLFSVGFSDADKSDLWRFSLCAAPSGSHVLCHELQPLSGLKQSQELSLQLAQWPLLMGQELKLTTRDLFGLSDTTVIASKAEPLVKSSLAHLPLSLKAVSDHERIVELSLKEQVPLNYRVINMSGEALTQGAWIVPGQYKINFSSDGYYYRLILHNKYDYSERELFFSSYNNTGPSCATHDINISMIIIILLYAWLLLVRRY